MKERIKKIRRHLDLSQESFGRKLGVTGTAISKIESGDRQPSEQILLSACREFGVNEDWLRNGEGEMFRQVSREEELSGMLAGLLKCEPSFRHRLISVLLRMSEDEWEMLERKAEELIAEMRKE